MLREELAAYKPAGADPEALVFVTVAGKPRDKDNIAKRVIKPVLEQTDKLLTKREEAPLPEGITPYPLWHTFGSLLVACGEDPSYVMAQLGHTDPQFTLRVYTHLMSRRDGERDRLKALVAGADWAAMGSEEAEDDATDPRSSHSDGRNSASEQGSVRRVRQDSNLWFLFSEGGALSS